MELYRHSTQLLCVRQDLTQITFQQFWQDVAQQCQAIKQMKPKTYALWEQSSYEFLVLLFAALQAEKEVLLPPHRIADLEQELAEQNIHFLSRQTCIPEINQTNELKFDDQFLNHAQIYFYTSGSTGQPKRIPRTLKQLMSEVAGLDASFHLPQQAIAIATVSHQHIYGLLFKVLWPLLTHRSFYDWQVAFPEDVVELQKTLSSLQIKNYVISSPALLKRWTSDVVLSNCDALYSSGGKLDAGILEII